MGHFGEYMLNSGLYMATQLRVSARDNSRLSISAFDSYLQDLTCFVGETFNGIQLITTLSNCLKLPVISFLTACCNGVITGIS
jgi:hypothetical protein